jgi:hypothetical protein
MPAKAIEAVLALAFLDDATHIVFFLLVVASPKEAKASTVVSQLHAVWQQNFANVNKP